MKKYPKIGIRPAIDARQGGIRESLEEKTMCLAKAVAELITSNLRNGDGSPVECVIADSTIGRVAESAACAEKFEREGVGATITVTSCWCYGSETMDMNPYYPKAVWGFNGTERPGAVYLAAVLAAHAQKGLPAFGIYGHDVQDLEDNSIPADVADKILRFARAAQAVATMRGKSYLSMGSVSMGIAGSIVNPDFLQEYLGIRAESIDLTEILRRIEGGIYDKEEFAKAMAWTEKYCKPNEGNDIGNREEKKKTRAEKDADWEFIVKMTLIMRDLMQGNPRLREAGFKEEALGHNAIAAGFQGQRQWTDFMPNGDFSEALLNTSFDWNGIREAYVVATENDCCNGIAMLFGHLLSNTGQIFSDVRTYWSPEAVKRITGKELTGRAAGGIIHLINSGATTLDGTGRQCDAEGNPVMKSYWEMTEKEVEEFLSTCGLTCIDALCAYLHRALAVAVAKRAGVEGKATDKAQKLAHALKNFAVDFDGNCDIKNAQAACGGLELCDFDSRTLESEKVEGLYALGEALDVDGDCGGFNLHWAWASAYAAATAICGGQHV